MYLENVTMRNFYISFLIAVVFLTSCNLQSSKEDVKVKYKIVGYAAGWTDWTKNNIDAEKLTHINYAFATISKSGELNIPTKTDSVNLAVLNSLKEKNKDLKIIISIGGWGAEYFSDAAFSDSSRLKFARSAISFMKGLKLDGVDLDWEYPGQIGGGNIFRAEDKENFTLMLKILREQLNVESDKDGRSGDNRYLLTIATGGDTEYMKHTELGIAHQYLDFINIMTYDLYNGLDTVTGHHTGLYQSAKSDLLRNSSADAVKGHIAAGVPAEKIVLGVAFYGRGWLDVNDKDNGLFQLAGKHISLSHDSIKTSYINKNGFTRYWDEDAKAPYLWNPESRTFITYADEESFIHKVNYVKTTGLGGVMFWEYSHDLKEKVLLNTLYKELNR
jgi:chitinase